jgi:uncharacterized protein (TIGR00369 family)
VACRGTRSADDRTLAHVRWEDPYALRDELAARSGLELMQLMASGELPPPPIAQTLGFRLVEAERGHALFECEPAEYHYNPIGIVHAGLAMTLHGLGHGSRLRHDARRAQGWTTLEMKANFTRALTADTGTVRCTGSVIHPGRRVATTEARIEDAQGRLCAHGTSTILVLDGDERGTLRTMRQRRARHLAVPGTRRRPARSRRAPRALLPRLARDGIAVRTRARRGALAEAWEAEGLYAAGRARTTTTYVICVPPPNVTGDLHMGHALNGSIQDVLVRWHRMRGFDTLWQPGYDHAGIATQNVVEKELAREGHVTPGDRREAFVERTWEWLEKTGRTIMGQYRRLGCSLDYSRERFTMDDDYVRAVMTFFVRLWDRGWIIARTAS